MLNDKMNKIISEVSGNLAERDELIHTIALALLTGKNLFVLGKPGQAKSMAIDLFRQHIVDAKQFEILMNKGTDAEQLFGRLDLASIIPGHISNSKLKADENYNKLTEDIKNFILKSAHNLDDMSYFNALSVKQEKAEIYRKSLAEVEGSKPEILTEGKIPDSHICFLDEIYKANDGVLNSLLKALNERVYTNEGVTTKIPVISFFSASNEIPNFNNPEEKSLEALYDRFDFKVNTRNVEDKLNRIAVLKDKESGCNKAIIETITLYELYNMQNEVKGVTVPDSIFELADNILCALREKDITVSDRTYFNFAPVVKAEAWLNGRDTVIPADMKVLVNYLWNKPEEYSSIADVIRTLTENPLGDKLNELTAKVITARDDFENRADKTRALLKFRQELINVYDSIEELKKDVSEGDPSLAAINSTIETIETISNEAHKKANFTPVSLAEIKALSID